MRVLIAVSFPKIIFYVHQFWTKKSYKELKIFFLSSKLVSETIIMTDVNSPLNNQKKLMFCHNYWLNQSHEKKKNSLETQGEQTVLPSYVEKELVLETTLLYSSSKCKPAKEQSS